MKTAETDPDQYHGDPIFPASGPMTRPLRSYIQALSRSNPKDIPPGSRWRFYDGMLFQSRAKWWADFGRRITCHEGLDIGLHQSGNRQPVWFHDRIRVPTVTAGHVLNICPDFLGYSVVVSLCSAPHRQSRFMMVYAHIIPRSDLVPGEWLGTHECIGTVADTAGKKSGIPSHLHLSVVETAAEITDDRLDWQLFSNPEYHGILLYNPWTCLPTASGSFPSSSVDPRLAATDECNQSPVSNGPAPERVRLTI